MLPKPLKRPTIASRCSYVVLLCIGLQAVILSSESLQSTREKFDRIVDGHLNAGELIIFSELEINSLLIHSPQMKIPPGISDLSVQLHADQATIDADVDFETVKMNSKLTPGVLIDLLLRGEHKLRLHCHVDSANGMGLIRITSLYIDDTPLQGTLLEWFLNELLVDQVPAVRFNEPFPLPKNLSYIRLETGRIAIKRF